MVGYLPVSSLFSMSAPQIKTDENAADSVEM